MIQKIRRANSFTLVELLVVISIIALLAGLALPAMNGAITKAQLLQATSNARQIHMSVQSAALDKANTQIGVGWPSTNYSTAVDYIKDLVNNGAVKQGDLRIFACVGITPATETASMTTANIGYHIYKADEADDANVVFLTTKNITYTTNAYTGLTGQPFKDKGFVVFRKGGDGTSYSNTNIFKVTTFASVIGATPSAVATDPTPLQ